MTKHTVPTLTLAHMDLTHRDSFLRFSQCVGDALSQFGFFGLCGHEITQELIADSYREARQFFELPQSTKQKYLQPQIIGQPRGYSSVGPASDNPNYLAQFKEFWHIGPNSERHNPNVWPSESPDFQQTFSKLYMKLIGVSR